MPTISSLQIGHTIFELAAAAGAEPCSSRATLEVMSSFSVDTGVLEVSLPSDTELSDGESRPGGRNTAALLAGSGGGAAGGAARPFPVPSTLPPPKLLREAIFTHTYMSFMIIVSASGSYRRSLNEITDVHRSTWFKVGR